jgi:hypothetical protein
MRLSALVSRRSFSTFTKPVKRVKGRFLPNCVIKSLRLGLMPLGILLVSCAQIEPSHLTNLAIDTYTPPANASQLAESHAKAYWAKHGSEVGRSARYLAVESYPVDPGDIPDLYQKLVTSPGVNSSDLEEYETNSDLDISCVNIFDTKLGRLVGNSGYAVVDLPSRGRVAQFGPYSAIFVGFGG